jgi:hypothetical protein
LKQDSADYHGADDSFSAWLTRKGMTYVAPWYLEPLWFLPTFAVFWLLITGMLAHLGGWASLARGYATQQSASGDRFRFASGSMGTRIFPVSYGNCLFVTVDAQGIYLSILFPFRFMAPPTFFESSPRASLTLLMRNMQ